jgi:hypothetical protein
MGYCGLWFGKNLNTTDGREIPGVVGYLVFAIIFEKKEFCY